MLKFSILFMFLALIRPAFADQYSLRHCALLPIVDNFGDALAFKVFEETEHYLNSAGWCMYKSNSDLMGVFSRYRHNLDDYLMNPDVIRSFATNLQVGTIIKVRLASKGKQVEVSLDILGENGTDLYLKESLVVDTTDPQMIFQTIKAWLDLYETTIPYEGRVLGVLGEQVTFSIEKDMPLKKGQKIILRRFIAKKKHPLLKKVVAWESKVVGRAKILSFSRYQGLARVHLILDRSNILKGDWVKFEEFEGVPDKIIRSTEENEEANARLGQVKLGLGVTDVNFSTEGNIGSSRFNEYIFGLNVEAEAWVTREYFVVGEFGQINGDISKSSGSSSESSTGYTVTTLKVGGGYKYLPLGYFFGPQINFYGGFASYSYTVDKSRDDGLASMGISGIYLGVGGSMPFQRGMRVFGRGEMIPFGEVEDKDKILGGNKTAGSMLLELGGEYQYRPTISFQGSYKLLNNDATFSGGISKMSHKSSNFIFATIIGF